VTSDRDAIRHALRLIEGFALTDPSLWPILSELDLVLRKPDLERVSAAGDRVAERLEGRISFDGS
jgi:hypothetical protein